MKEAEAVTDRELLEAVLARDAESGGECLTSEQRTAFRAWWESGRGRPDGFLDFTPKQLAWLRGVGERLGIQTAPSENLFSQLSPARQAEMRKNAARVKLPWEK